MFYINRTIIPLILHKSFIFIIAITLCIYYYTFFMHYTCYEVLPFILTNLLREEVEEHNSHHSGSPDVDPSQDLIRVTNVLLRWYQLFRQTTPASAKTPSDVGICKPSLTGLFLLYTICVLYALCIYVNYVNYIYYSYCTN